MLHVYWDNRGECSKQDFHFPEGSHLNNNTGLQQRRDLNDALSAGTSSAALQEDRIGITAQTLPLQDQCSIVSESKQVAMHPLLYNLLKGNPPDSKFCTTPCPSSEETLTEMNSDTNLSDKNCRGGKVKSSQTALNCGQTTTQHLDHSRGTHYTLNQQQVSSSSFNGQLSTNKVSTDGETEPLDDRKVDFIVKRLAKLFKNRNNGHTHTNKGRDFCTNDRNLTLPSDGIRSNSVAHLPRTSASAKDDVERQSLNCAIIAQSTAAAGQAGEDSSKGSKADADLLIKSKETGDCSTPVSEKPSTGTLISAVGNSSHAYKNESVENCASAALDLPVKKHLDVTMHANGKLIYSDHYKDKTFFCSNDKSFHSKCYDKHLQSGLTTLHYSLTALKELIASLENIETIAEMDNLSKVILQQYWNGNIDNIHLFTSTEYPQIMMKVAAICAKSEDESPVVLTAVSEMTLDEPTEKHSSALNCSLPPEEYKPLQLNIKNVDGTQQVPSVGWTFKHMTEEEKGEPGLKLVETLGLDNVHAKSSLELSENKMLLENPKNNIDEQHCYVSNKDVIAHSKLNSSIDKIHEVSMQSESVCHAGVRKDAGSVFSQTDLSIAVSENKVKEHGPLFKGKGEEAYFVQILKDPFYEDISDEDISTKTSQLPKITPNSEHEESSFPVEYEDISEDENLQMENMSVEKPLLTQVPECNNERSPLGNKGHEHGQAHMKTEAIISDEELIQKKQVSPETHTPDIAQHCSPCFIETNDFEGLLSPKCDSNGHLRLPTNSVSCSPFSFLNETDQMEDDDDWIVIPISMSDLKFEMDDEDQNSPENVLLDDDDDEEQNSPENVLLDDDDDEDQNSPENVLLDDDDDDEEQNSPENVLLDDDEEQNSSEKVLLDDDDEEQNSPENFLLDDDDDETGDKERSYVRSPTHHESQRPVPKPVLASASTGKLEVFDTIQSFQQAKCLQFKNIFEMVSDEGPSEHEVDSGGEAYKLQNRSESYPEHEDSSDTEDSCDYSPGPEQNYMTVKLWKKWSTLLTPETGEVGEVLNVQERKEDDVIILDSDTEDEDDQIRKKKANRKRIFSSGSEDSSDATYSQQKRHSPETVDSRCGNVKAKFKKSRLPSADSPAPEHQSKPDDTQFKEVMQDACSDRSHSTGKSGTETKAVSDHVEQKTNRQKISEKDDVIILDSDTEDDDDQNYKKKAKRKRFSSGSSDGGDAPCVQQKRHAPETVNSLYGNVKAKFKKRRLPSADSSVPQHQSEVDDTQFKEVMQDACSDQSHAVKKSGHLIGAKSGSDHIQHKTNRQTTSKRKVSRDSDEVLKKDVFSKKKRNTKNILSSGSEDSSDSLFAKQNSPTETQDHLCGTANKKPEKNTPLSEDLPEKRLQSVDTESQNPVIPQILFRQSTEPNGSLQLLKQSRVHRQDKDETQGPKCPTSTRKQTDSSDINMTHLFRKKKVRFVSEPQFADETHHATKNKFQANVTQPRLSPPSQEPSSPCSSSLSGKGSEARQSSASQKGLSQSGETSTSSSFPKSKQNASILRNVSSSTLRRSHSNGNPSTLEHPYTPTQGQSFSATMQSSARKQVTAQWQNGYYPTRRDRKTSLGMEDDLKTTNHNTGREARPGPRHYDRAPKLRHNSDSATPLMKKSQIDARQWTKAITRDAPRKLGSGVTRQRTVPTPTKGDTSRISNQGFGREGRKRRSTIPL